MTKEYVSVNSLSTGEKNELKDAISELHDSMTRVDAEKSLQKDMLDDISEKLNLDKKLIRKMASVFHRSSFNEEREFYEDFETLYNKVFSE